MGNIIKFKDAIRDPSNFGCMVFHNEEPIFVNDDSYFMIDTIRDHLIKNRAYVIGGFVYPYRGTVKYFDDINKPGIYNIDKILYIRKVENEKEKSCYSVKNISSISYQTIVSEIEKNKEVFITDEDIEMINSSSKEYVPTINVDDDPLKKIIKMAIINKDVNINIYKKVFGKKHGLNNIKSALTGKSKLTMARFLEYCELLKLDYTISVSDNGEDTLFPLTTDILYDSKTNEVTKK